MNTTKRGIATRRRILEAAAELTYKNGVNGTSVDDVLKASGTGKSQFYHYFASKDALVNELIAHQLSHHQGLAALAVGPLRGRRDFSAWLERVVQAYKNGAFPGGCPLGNLTAELSVQNDGVRASLLAIFERWENELTAAFRGMKVNSVLRPDADPVRLAVFCLAAVEGALLLAKNSGSVAPIEAAASELGDLIQLKCLGASAANYAQPELEALPPLPVQAVEIAPEPAVASAPESAVTPEPAPLRTLLGATSVAPKPQTAFKTGVAKLPVISPRAPKNLGFCP